MIGLRSNLPSRLHGAKRPWRRRLRSALARLAIVLVASAGLVPTAARADDDDAPAAPKTWHCTAYVRSSMGLRVIDYWSRGPDMVARTLIRGHPITTIVSGGRYIVFDGVTGEGVDIARSAEAIALDAKRPRPFAFELDDIKADGGEKIEDVTLGAMRGEIWQVRDGQGRRKLWMSTRAPAVPLRVETYDRATSETIELDYQGWTFDMDLPDRFFTPPAGLALVRFDQKSWLSPAPGEVRPRVPILYPDLVFGAPPD